MVIWVQDIEKYLHDEQLSVLPKCPATAPIYGCSLEDGHTCPHAHVDTGGRIALIWDDNQ